jgi:hypothetical protein
MLISLHQRKRLLKYLRRHNRPSSHNIEHWGINASPLSPREAWTIAQPETASGRVQKASWAALITGSSDKRDLQYSTEKSRNYKDIHGPGRRGAGRVCASDHWSSVDIRNCFAWRLFRVVMIHPGVFLLESYLRKERTRTTFPATQVLWRPLMRTLDFVHELQMLVPPLMERVCIFCWNLQVISLLSDTVLA